MTFGSRSNLPKTLPVPSGEAIQPEFCLQVDKSDSVIKPVVCGKRNVYEEIQAPLDSTLIYNILAQYSDINDFNSSHPALNYYGDTTAMPKTLAEVEQTYINNQQLFASLPLELRQAYDNNLSLFLKAVASGDIKDVLLSQAKKIQNDLKLKELEKVGVSNVDSE